MALTINIGADFEFGCSALDSNRDAVDLTGYTVESEIRDARGGALIIACTVDLAYGDSNQFLVSLTNAQTEGLTEGFAVLEFKVTDASAKVRYSKCIDVRIKDVATD